jgi:hypothetical protein
MRKAVLYLLLIAIGVLSAALTQAQQNTAIQIGQTVTGTISNADPVDTYTFTGTAGQLLAIALRAPVQGLDPYVKLVAPDGQEFYNDDSGQSLNSMLIVSLPANGDYTLYATRCCDMNSPSASEGQYELHIEEIIPVDISVGTPLLVHLDDTTPFAYVTLNNLPAQQINLVGEITQGDAGLVIEIRDANGMVINSATQTPDGRISFEPLMIPQDGNGTVMLVMYRQSNTGSVAGTSVTANVTTSAIEATSITIGQTLTGTLDDNNPSDYYRFSVNSSDILRLEGTNTESFGVGQLLEMLGNNPEGEQPFEVMIYGASGYMMMGGNTGYGTEPNKFLIDPLQLATSGEYLMVVRRANMGGTTPLGTSHYSVTLSGTTTPMIEMGVAIVAGFEPNTWERVYRLEAQAGQAIRLTLSSESGASYGPSINVQGPQISNPNMPTPDGMGMTYYFSANSSAAGTITYEVTLPHDGVYIFRVGDSAYNPADGQPDGTFRLLVEDVNN